MTRDRVRKLRADQTDAERKLWQALRGRRFADNKFRRQVPLGPYIVDFLSYSDRLVIELDGGQHTERVEYDAARTRWIEAQGYRVLRFWNDDALRNTDGVLDVIRGALRADPLP